MNIPLTLKHLRPTEEWTLNGDTYDGLTWLSDTPKPTEQELIDAYPLAVAAADAAAAVKAAARAALLVRLGITEDEAALLREAGI